MTIYETLKKSIPVPDAAAQYGMEISRNGMVRCPFHNDSNPSMKLNDDYFFCFGCGERGDAIDLTAALCGLQAEQERKVFIALTEHLYLLRDWIVRYAPKTPDEELDPRFVEACHDLDRVEYLVDVLCTGDEIERREVVKMMLSGGVRDSPVDRAG